MPPDNPDDEVVMSHPDLETTATVRRYQHTDLYKAKGWKLSGEPVTDAPIIPLDSAEAPGNPARPVKAG